VGEAGNICDRTITTADDGHDVEDVTDPDGGGVPSGEVCAGRALRTTEPLAKILTERDGMR